MKKFLSALFLIGSLTLVHAQAGTVTQSGYVTPGHAAMWITSGVIGDGGSAASGNLTSIGVTASGPAICQNSGLISGAYNQICLGVTQTGGGQISLTNNNGGTGGLTFSLNGASFGFGAVQLPVTTNDVVCIFNTSGQLKDCGFSNNGPWLPLAGGTMTGTITGSDGGSWGTGGINGSIIGSTTPEAATFTTEVINSTLTYGGVTLSASVTGTGSMVLSNTPTLTTPKLAGSSTGTTEFASANASATNYTVTFPANTGTLPELNLAQSWSALQTFGAADLAVLGSSTGYTNIESANAGASNYVATLPAATDTIVESAQTQTLTNKTLASSTDVFGGVTMTLGSDATGDIYYRNSSGILTRLPIGTTGYVLTVSSGLPAWETAGGASSITVGSTAVNSGTSPYVLYNNGGTLGNEAIASIAVSSLNSQQGAVTLASSGGSTVTSSGGAVTIGEAGGFLNRFRNGTFDIWQRGTSGLSTSTSITSASSYTADGWQVQPAGATVTCAQATGNTGQRTPLYALKCTGASSNTDTIIFQRIESFIAAVMAGQTVTIQFQYQQNSGSSVTPKLVSCYPSSADTWDSGTDKANCASNSDATTDLSATSISSCATATWCTESYTFNVSANATKGYEIDIDCNTALTSAESCEITAADIRVTPNVSTGINSNPPPPELRPVAAEQLFCDRYYEAALPVFQGGYISSSGITVGQGITYRTVMRATPSFTWTTASLITIGTPTADAATNIGVSVVGNSSSSGAYEMSGTVTFSAEL